MDLRQYLIAPHERPQQQSVHCETSDLDHQHHVTQHQSQQHLQNETLTREQVIRGLAAHPDILATILRSGNMPTKVQDEKHDKATEKRSSIKGVLPQDNALVSTRCASTSLSTRTLTASEALPTLTTPSVTRKASTKLCFWYYHNGDCTSDPLSPNYNGGRVCPYLHTRNGGKEAQLQKGLWHWHKRFGDCGLELCRFSSRFKGSGEHQNKMTRAMNVVKGKLRSAVPAAAAAGLSGESSSGAISNRAKRYPSSQSTAGKDQKDEIKETTISIPTSPRTGRHGNGQRLQRQQHHQSPTTAPAPLPPKRKASLLSPMTGNTAIPAAHSSSTKKPRTSRVFSRSSRTSTANTSTPTSTLPPTTSTLKQTKALRTAKPLDVITYPLPSTSHDSIKASEHNKPVFQTCFLWYHGRCPHTGQKCRFLHALTDPPSFVQPPRGFVHGGQQSEGEEEGKCTRDWCPGDWLWDHEDEDSEIEVDGDETGDDEVEET